MNAISTDGFKAVLAGMCSVSYLYFGMYIGATAIKEKRIRPLLYACLFSALWCFTYMMYYLSADVPTRELWQRFTFAGMLSFAFILWFLIQYTGLIKNQKIKALLFILLWLPHATIAYKSISANAVVRDFPFGFWFLFMEIVTTVYNLGSITLFFIFYLRNKTNKTRRQTYILIISALILIILSWGADYYFGFRETQNLIPFWLLLWIGVLLFIIKKYRFISITLEFIGRDITENIEEGIILLDPELNIIFTNASWRKLVNSKEGEHLRIWDIVAEKHILDAEFAKLQHTGAISCKIQLHLIVNNNAAKLPIDIKLKKVIDAYDDISGFLMIVSRAKDIGYLKARYGISARELDVIRHLSHGSSNKNLAQLLGIKESTIESHITNIYNKLGIKNRVELLSLLSEYNVSKQTPIVPPPANR